MMLVRCAVCDEKIMLSDDSIPYITPIGLVHNICSNECLIVFNNADVVLENAVSTKERGRVNVR